MVALALSLSAVPVGAQEGRFAYSIEISREIAPRTAHELTRSLEDARRRRAAVVVVRLNTPGGLIESMRQMIKAITEAPMPVIVYVHPDGGRASSAGVFLTLAADVAAMAPLTTIGSATPVRFAPPARSESEEQLLRDLRRKAINSTASMARALADSRDRNAELAERMVRTAENVSAQEALKAKLIDVVAPDERALLRMLDGFAIRGPKAQRLRTSGLEIKRFGDGPATVTDFNGFDNFSTLRLMAYIAAFALIIALTVMGRGRGRRALRRWQVRRHRAKLQRRRASQASKSDRP